MKYTYYKSNRASRRNNPGVNEDGDRLQRKFDQDDANRVRLRFDARHYESKNSDPGNVEHHWDEPAKEKLNLLPSKLSAVRLNSAKTIGLQTLTRSKNTEDLVNSSRYVKSSSFIVYYKDARGRKYLLYFITYITSIHYE